MLVLTYSPLYSNHFLFAPETGNAFNYGHCSGSKPLRYHPSSETGSGNLVQMVPQQTPSKAQGRAVEWKGGTYAQLQEGFCDAREGRCRPAGHGGNLRVGGQQEGDDGHFKSGCGKGLLVQAPGVAACRKLHKVCHVRLADLFDDLMRCRSAALPPTVVSTRAWTITSGRSPSHSTTSRPRWPTRGARSTCSRSSSRVRAASRRSWPPSSRRAVPAYGGLPAGQRMSSGLTSSEHDPYQCRHTILHTRCLCWRAGLRRKGKR